MTDTHDLNVCFWMSENLFGLCCAVILLLVRTVPVHLVLTHTGIEIPSRSFLFAVSGVTRQFKEGCRLKLLADVFLNLALVLAAHAGSPADILYLEAGKAFFSKLHICREIYTVWIHICC